MSNGRIQAGVTSIMCAYNQLNGTSSCHNAGLLGPTGLVRSAGFQGACCASQIFCEVAGIIELRT